MTKKQTWRNYLRYLKKRARRTALKEARLSTNPDALPRRGMIDGQSGVQLEYVPLLPNPPWSEADIERFEALANGGEWEES